MGAQTALTAQGFGWSTDAVGPASVNTTQPHRNVTIYGASTRLWGKQWAVGANATILSNTGLPADVVFLLFANVVI